MVPEHVTSCPVCGNQSFQPFISTEDFTVTRETFSLVRCAGCDLLITSPRPAEADIGKYYQSADYISHTNGGASLFDIAYRTVRRSALRRKLNLVNRHQPAKGTILDFGCGTGSFLETCTASQWSATGVEPSAAARERIPPGITVYENPGKLTEDYNAITLWHVLEHIHRLPETLSQLSQRLKTGGTIFIAVPNPESYDAQHYQQYWAAYDLPRHLWHFNKKNMKRLLESKGLKLDNIQPMKLDAYYVSLLSERYKNPGTPAPLRLINATITAWRSNLKAGTDNHSSLIYIASK